MGESLSAAKNKYDAWANRGAGRKLLDKEHKTNKNLHWVERSHGTDVDGNIAWGNIDLTDSMLDSAKPPQAILDDVSGNGTFATSWLGFAVVDHQTVIDKSATALPSASQLSSAVDLVLSTDAGEEMVIRGRVVRVSFTAPKVNYDVAVPISRDASGGVSLYAVIANVDSALIRPSTEQDDVANVYAAEIESMQQSIMDSVHEAAGETFSGGEWDTLLGMKQSGKVEDGDVVSKASRDSLVERGFVERGDGMNWLTEKGQEVAAALDAVPYQGMKRTAFATALTDDDDETVKVKFCLSDGCVWEVRDIGAFKTDIKAESTGEAFKLLRADKKYRQLKAYGVLDAVDVPTASFKDPQVVEAVGLAARVLGGETLDAADFSHAIATLQNALDTVETNYPINVAEGDLEQAELEEAAADDFRKAIQLLETAAASDTAAAA